ncbi:MAG: YjbQ family protein [Candidatus Odinarchaeota archaeon]|nr:YjbQ family protein [Candidatus Odinarchaeota archaeon]
MKVVRKELHFNTAGEIDVVNITGMVEKAVKDSGIRNGLVTVFIPGATGAITTIEFEPNLVQDFKDILEKLIPKTGRYRHPVNGHSHLRASMLGPSLSVPVADRNLILGTWQQIVFVELDVRPRSRRLIVQIIGE